MPVSVTTVPTAPLLGVKEVITGPGGRTVKSVTLNAEPPTFVTLILPVVAAPGTTARICVALSTINAAVVTLNCTAVTPVK